MAVRQQRQMAERTRSGSAGNQGARIPYGPAAAALLSAGIGAFALGLIVSVAEASAGISSALNLYNPVGALSGKTIFAVVVWLVSWIVLHSAWKSKDVKLNGVMLWTVVLMALGFLLTFPPVFDLFAPK